jgi:DNA polymerase family A
VTPALIDALTHFELTPATVDALAHFGLTRPTFIDFEYYAPPGCNPRPICVAWVCPTTGEFGTRWLWDDPQPCPFPMTAETVLLSYNITAEVSWFLALNWLRPTNVIDLWLEYGQTVNVWPTKALEWKPRRAAVKKPRKGLLDAMRAYGLEATPSEVKAHFQQRAQEGPPWSDEDREQIPAYCLDDVAMIVRLAGPLLAAADAGDPERMYEILNRGLYNVAAATEVFAGIPMNCRLLASARKHRHALQEILIQKLDHDQVFLEPRVDNKGVWRNAHLDRGRMTKLIIDRGYAALWPRLESGLFCLDRKTIGHMARPWFFPELADLATLGAYLGHMRPFDFDVGVDGRARTSFFPFATKTGRNAPSTTKYILMTDKGFRGFIQPAAGWSIACLDYHCEEMMVGGRMSNDHNLIALAESPDAYLSLGRIVGLNLEADPREEDYRDLRKRLKPASLGLLYQIGIESLARLLGLTIARAEHVWRNHRAEFRVFWKWAESLSDLAAAGGTLRTPLFGHALGYGPDPIAAFNSRTASNFGVQAVAGDIMRAGSIFAMQTRPARTYVLGSAHDAYAIEAPTEQIDSAVAWMGGVMDRAVKTVLGPKCAIRVKVKITHGPNACDWEESDLFDLIKAIILELEKGRNAA